PNLAMARRPEGARFGELVGATDHFKHLRRFFDEGDGVGFLLNFLGHIHLRHGRQSERGGRGKRDGKKSGTALDLHRATPVGKSLRGYSVFWSRIGRSANPITRILSAKSRLQPRFACVYRLIRQLLLDSQELVVLG